jgi:proline-rich protein PRCC
LHVRALEKGTAKGFEGLATAEVEEVDARKEMERAKVELKEREERKAVTKGADGGPVAPKMTLNVSFKQLGIVRVLNPYFGWIGEQAERHRTF